MSTNPRLVEALEILAGIDADDSSIGARGYRAHARVISMIEFADQVSEMREQALIANLLTLAGMKTHGSEAALARALRLLAPNLEEADGPDPS